MAMEHLVAAIAAHTGKMTANERTRKVRELVAESKENETFIRQNFPELYAEAFPCSKSWQGASSESNWQPSLYAKP